MVFNRVRLAPGTSRFLNSHNIELSSAAEHAPRSRFLAGRDSQFKSILKATAPTIC
jgi:hypothetical protein